MAHKNMEDIRESRQDLGKENHIFELRQTLEQANEQHSITYALYRF